MRKRDEAADALSEAEHLGRIKGELAAEDRLREREALAMVPEHLAPYSDGRPFSRERAYVEIEVLLHNEMLHAQGVVRARIEIGKRLILLHEMAGVPVLRGGDRRSGDFQVRQADLKREMEMRFPRLTHQRRSEYMAIARAAVEYPNKFRQFLEGTGGMKKGLALIRNLEEKELKALDAGGEAMGATLDEFADMSREDLVEALRRAKQKIERGREQLEEKEREIERLQKGYRPTEEGWEGMMRGFVMRFDQLMDRMDPEVMEALRKENNPTGRMKAQYLVVLEYMKLRILAACDMAEDVYGTAEMYPDKVWRPGMGAEAEFAAPDGEGR